MKGYERAAGGAAGGTGTGEAGRKRGFGGRNNDHRARGLGMGGGLQGRGGAPVDPGMRRA